MNGTKHYINYIDVFYTYFLMSWLHLCRFFCISTLVLHICNGICYSETAAYCNNYACTISSVKMCNWQVQPEKLFIVQISILFFLTYMCVTSNFLFIRLSILPLIGGIPLKCQEKLNKVLVSLLQMEYINPNIIIIIIHKKNITIWLLKI